MLVVKNGQRKSLKKIMPKNYQGIPNFLIEVAKGNIPGESFHANFATNDVITPATDPESVWPGGDMYDFFPAVAQAMEAVSTHASDSGEVLASGSASGGSAISLEDKDADFIADGIAIGDLVINDTRNTYGHITDVTGHFFLHGCGCHRADTQYRHDDEHHQANDPGSAVLVWSSSKIHHNKPQ